MLLLRFTVCLYHQAAWEGPLFFFAPPPAELESLPEFQDTTALQHLDGS